MWVKLVPECQIIPHFAAARDNGADGCDNWNSQDMNGMIY